MRRCVICTAESGWRGTREISIFLAHSGIYVEVIIKGFVEKEILDLITKYDFINIISVRKKFFRPYILWRILKQRITEGLRCVITDKPRTQRWINKLGSILRFRAFGVVETARGHEVFAKDSERVENILEEIQ